MYISNLVRSIVYFFYLNMLHTDYFQQKYRF